MHCKIIAATSAVSLMASAAWSEPAGPMVPASQVIAVIGHDWTGDGGRDRAVLVHNADAGMADLLLYVGTETLGEMRLAARADAIAWAGQAWGTQPSMTQNRAGSLLVQAGNMAIGRHRWQETVTIAWRDGRFVVAGFTFESYDTLDPGLTRRCDTNYLAGRGVLDGATEQEEFEVPAGGVPVAEWSGQHVPPECAAG